MFDTNRIRLVTRYLQKLNFYAYFYVKMAIKFRAKNSSFTNFTRNSPNSTIVGGLPSPSFVTHIQRTGVYISECVYSQLRLNHPRFRENECYRNFRSFRSHSPGWQHCLLFLPAWFNTRLPSGATW